MNQLQMFYEVQRKLGEGDRAFMELVNHPTNPMTNADLKALLERHPDRYSRYAGFVGKLRDTP